MGITERDTIGIRGGDILASFSFVKQPSSLCLGKGFSSAESMIEHKVIPSDKLCHYNRKNTRERERGGSKSSSTTIRVTN